MDLLFIWVKVVSLRKVSLKQKDYEEVFNNDSTFIHLVIPRYVVLMGIERYVGVLWRSIVHCCLCIWVCKVGGVRG